MTKDCEILVWPKFMVKMPKPDKILSPEEFKEILTQDIAGLGKEGKVSWILLLGYSVSDSIAQCIQHRPLNNLGSQDLHLRCADSQLNELYQTSIACLCILYSLKVFTER